MYAPTLTQIRQSHGRKIDTYISVYRQITLHRNIARPSLPGQRAKISRDFRYGLTNANAVQGVVGWSPRSRLHSWDAEALSLGQGYSHKGGSRGHQMSPHGLPGSLPNYNLLRCRNRTPQGTGTSNEVEWEVAREAVPEGTGAESWGQGWCTRSWKARCLLARALRPSQRGRKMFLSLHP